LSWQVLTWPGSMLWSLFPAIFGDFCKFSANNQFLINFCVRPATFCDNILKSKLWSQFLHELLKKRWIYRNTRPRFKYCQGIWFLGCICVT
jgi:hypothetical protein